jgi:hypothetical protein
MGREFETDNAKCLIDEVGNSLPYKLSECYLKMDGSAGLGMFRETRDGDFVTFYGEEPKGMSNETIHPVFLLIRDGRVVAKRRPYDGSMFD